MKYLSAMLLTLMSIGVYSQNYGQLNVQPVSLDALRPARYARSFCDVNGDVHVMGLFKITLQEDGQLVTRALNNPVFPPTLLNESQMNTFFSKPGLFIALNNRLDYKSETTYSTKMWRSEDNLQTIKETEALFILPEAGKVDFGKNTEWAGLFCHRAILQLSDGSLLAAMYGNFEKDTITPVNPQSKMETKYKLRAFVVRSTDSGYTWHYLSTLIVPDSETYVNSEGFNEWSMVQLNNGHILAAVRTGHFTPLVFCRSENNGKTWSHPVSYPELGPAGCDPYLLKLHDGRIGLAYGEMIQPPVDTTDNYSNVPPEKTDHRRRCRIAFSDTPLATSWKVYNITDYDNRSAYPTIFQVGSGMILYQSDLELFQVQIPTQ